MNKIIVQFNGETITKTTKRSDISHVVVSLYNGKQWVISGMFSSLAGAEARIGQGWNPTYSEHVVVAVADDIESGLTSEDWEPTAETRYYAQQGEKYAFGSTEKEAREKLGKEDL